MADEIFITKDFIQNQLPIAPPLYTCIYLIQKAFPDATQEQVAEILNVLESDVVGAWKYWKTKDVSSGVIVEKKITIIEEQNIETPLLLERKPAYSTEELSEYMKHKEMKALLQTAQKKLAKPLSQQDISMIFGFYDWLGLPINVIEMLLSYCVSDGFKGMRYIEKVAMGWAEDGINTIEKATEYIEMRKVKYGGIMRAFGQTGRGPIDAEEAYMKKWLKEYRLPMDVLQLACQRTVLQTGKISFAYADRIVMKWKEAGVKTLEDIEVLDKAFVAKKTIQDQSQESTITKKQAPKQNRFINYTQREWDFEKLEQLQREERDKW